MTNNTERDALLPCPFCGGNGVFVRPSAGIKNTAVYDSWHSIVCSACGAGMGASDRRFRTKEDATKVWNTRAAIAHQASATERDAIHSCSYFCDQPECIKQQRDELRDKLAHQAAEPITKAVQKTHAAKGRYHTQIAMCELYDLVGLPNVKPGQDTDPSTPLQEVAQAGLESSVGHLSVLVDDLRRLLGMAMQAMKAVEDEAQPQNDSAGDFDAVIPYENWARFVDARSRLLYEITHSPHEGSVETVKQEVAVPAWQPIATAKQDGTPVLLKMKLKLPKMVDRFSGLIFVGSNRGTEVGWSFAAPVGMGGIIDDWIEGWKPLESVAAAPTHPAPDAQGKAEK